MKSYVKLLISITAALLVISGCEWDGPTAVYNQAQPDYPNASISGIDPESAEAGVNYITILGENFADSLTANQVFFDNIQVDIIESTPTSLTVRRPKNSGDSLTINVVAYNSLIVATYESYQVDTVFSTYGNMVENKELEALAVDDTGTLYVIQRDPKSIHKITPDGRRTVIGETVSIPTHAVIAPNGNLTYFKDKRIRQVDLITGVNDTLVELKKNAEFGDYDENGNLFTGGGRRSDLMIVRPDNSFEETDLYSSDKILYIRVVDNDGDNYVYILAEIDDPDENTPELGIFRHEIQDANGTLGEREVVFDWALTDSYVESTPAAFAFSQDGILFVGTDNLNPILMIDLENGTQDIMYKDILTGVIAEMAWGSGNHLYYLKDEYEDEEGNSDELFDLMRVDMGKPGVPY